MQSPGEMTSTWIEDLAFDWLPHLGDATVVNVTRETYLYEQSDLVATVFVVDKGRVRLSLSSETGDEKTIMIVGRNGIVGEIGLFDNGVHVTSAITSTDSTLYAFPAQTFHALIATHHEVAQFTLANMGRKFRILSLQSLNLSYASAQYRVVKCLSELSHTYGVVEGSGVRIDIRFTHQEMANLAGTTRVTVAQVFGQLEKNGLLEKHQGYFVITSMDGVSALLNSPKTSHFKSMSFDQRRQ